MIKLIVKAANGSVEDFGVDADKGWTVYQVKSHIYRHYPSHPPITVQKLIYGGKLLLDQMTLSEILPAVGGKDPSSSPDDDSFVIHLVAYQRSNSAPTPTSAKMDTSSHTRWHTRALPPAHETTGERPSVVAPIENGGDRSGPEHSQHVPPINPWLRHRGMGVANPPGLQNVPMFGGPMGGYPFALPPQFYQSPYGAAYLQQWYNYYRVPGGGGGGGGGGNLQPDLLPNPDEPNDLPEAEDQADVPVNAPGGLGMMGGAQGGGGMRHRDLVDYVYMFTMVGFLILVAYLTGSLGRLVIFAAGVMFMLLNQGGFFSLRRRRQPVHVPVPAVNHQGAGQRPDNPQVPDQRENNPEVPVEERGSGDNPDNHNDVDAPPLPPEEERRPGIIATVFVFIASFFTSLVPQQRPDLQVN